METLHIQQFQARYHLPPSMVDQQDRLDRLLAEMLDGALALTLERLGISPREEICIRRLHVPVRFVYDSADTELILAWSMALARGFHEVITGNDPDNIIRYSTRIHGFIDFADGVARGDLHRAWAWQRMDFSVARKSDSVSGAAEGLVRSLIRESQYILPVLTAMAATGRLGRLLHRLMPVQWQDLAMAALMAHGADDENTTAVPDRSTQDRESVRDRQVADRIVGKSALAAVVARECSCFPDAEELLSVWAIFILLETEPVLLRNAPGRSEAVLQAVAERIRQDLHPGGSAPPEHAGPEKEPGRRKDGSGPGPEESAGTGIAMMQDTVPLPGAAETQENRELTAFGGRSGNDFPGKEDNPVWEPVGQERLSSDPGPGFTEFGGLLFLLPLLERSGILDEILDADRFDNRSLRWFLHGLALSLLPIEAEDPAALAFCGLGSADPLPWKDEPGPNETEKKLLISWRRKLIRMLVDHLGRRMAPEQVLYTICCRKARIVTDPGWFEIIFSLSEVSTEIRRAGLDIDPGFIPWLGVVVKFYYE